MAKTIGVVVAMNRETGVLGHFPHEKEIVAGFSFNLFKAGENNVILAECGIGETYAAAATALLIGRYKVDEIINYGYVGALEEDTPMNAVFAVQKVLHTDFDLTAFGLSMCQYDGRDKIEFTPDAALTARIADLPLKTLASADKFVWSGDRKKELNQEFDAHICDMEGAGVASVADKAGVPYALVKIVADGVESDCTDEFFKNSVFGIEPLVKLICDYLEK